MAPSRPSFASAAASPGRGPKPARHSSRSACDASNVPRYTGAPTGALSSAPRATPHHSLEAFDQQDAGLAPAVVVLVDALDVEAERLVEGDRPLVDRRRHRTDDRTRRDSLEEAVVELAGEAGPPMRRVDADEVDVRLIVVRLGAETARNATTRPSSSATNEVSRK